MEASFEVYDGIAGFIVVPEGCSGGVVEENKKSGGNRNYRSLLGREHQGADLEGDGEDQETQPQSVALMVFYSLPEYKAHIPALLPGVVAPRREVEDFAIYHIDRRSFQGEAAIRIVERVFGLDASQDPVYSFSSGRRNFAGQEYGGYRNNHAVYGADTAGGMLRLGARRRYQEFQASSVQQGHEEDDRELHRPEKRRRHSPGRYEGYSRPQIDYNIRRGGGGNQSSVLQNY